MSQGQRFRRRALRRGYKVDEVDSFLDRVEATLAGDPIGAPVTSQEVHDVVFRVRFGGYDEWQVDLHLDRVERQLTELEERGGGGFGRAMEPRTGDVRMPPPERMAPERLPERMGPERMGPPPLERMAPERMPERMGPAPMDRMPPPPPMPTRPTPMAAGPPPRDMRDPGYGRYDDPGYRGGGPGFEDDRYEPAPRGARPDMTTEIRMDRGPEPATYGGPGGDPYGGPGGGPGGDPYGAPGGDPYGPPVQHQSTEVARIDQLRRTFQLRRFGSGYDRGQVDRLFEGVMAALSGRGGPLTDGDLDPSHFDLVPGGYFEAEVDAALKEVRDILTRRR